MIQFNQKILESAKLYRKSMDDSFWQRCVGLLVLGGRRQAANLWLLGTRCLPLPRGWNGAHLTGYWEHQMIPRGGACMCLQVILIIRRSQVP